MSYISEILGHPIDDIRLFDKRGERICAIEGGGKYNGIEYLIIFTDSGIRCGYVALPKESKVEFPENYDDFDIECHGGLTFMGDDLIIKSLLEIECNDMWLGFDTGHSWDLIDKEACKKYYPNSAVLKIKMESELYIAKTYSQIHSQKCSVKSFHYVENECKKIIDQLVEKYL